MNIDFLESVLREAGDYALKKQDVAVREETEDSAETEYEKDKSAATEVDIECQKIILEKLGSKYPNEYSLLAEESGLEIRSIEEKYFSDDSNRTLVLDPIDGTRNYTREEGDEKRNYWAVSACILENKEPVKGVIYYPALKTVLKVEKGKGAFINGKKVEFRKMKYSSSDPVRVSGSFLRMGDGIRSIFSSPQSLRCLAVTFLCMLQTCSSSNTIESLTSYVGYKTYSWDLGCATLAVEEAGGFVMNQDGSRFNPFANMDDENRVNQIFVAAPGRDYALSIFEKIKGNIKTI